MFDPRSEAQRRRKQKLAESIADSTCGLHFEKMKSSASKKNCGRGSNVDKGIEGHLQEAASVAGVRRRQQAADPAEFMRRTTRSSLPRTLFAGRG
jgi:hypothetical protein